MLTALVMDGIREWTVDERADLGAVLGSAPPCCWPGRATWSSHRPVGAARPLRRAGPGADTREAEVAGQRSITRPRFPRCADDSAPDRGQAELDELVHVLVAGRRPPEELLEAGEGEQR